LLAQLAPQASLRCFTDFQFSAREFPAAGMRTIRCALGDQHTPFAIAKNADHDVNLFHWMGKRHRLRRWRCCSELAVAVLELAAGTARAGLVAADLATFAHESLG